MERRRTERVESVNLVSIESEDEENRLTSGHLARTLDLSTGGAKVEITSAEPFSVPVGEELFFTMTLGEKVVPARGRVVYARRESEQKTILGIAFTELAPEDRQAIRKFIGT